jgi:metaxin
LRFAQVPFDLSYNLIHPDSDQIPYVESGVYVAYNNEKGGVIESLKRDGIVDLDSEVNSNPEWISTKAMIQSWLEDAVMHELWLGSDTTAAYSIYYADLPWPMGKLLYWKQAHFTKQLLGITQENADRIEEEIYRKASIAYQALSTRLGDQPFFFNNGPTSLDAVFLAHALITLHALPESSVLKSKILEHTNLVSYAEKHKTELLDAASSSSPSSSSWTPKRGGPSNFRSKPKSKPKKEKTEEEKRFRRRAKYFLVTQMVAVLVFLSLMSRSNDSDVDFEDEEYANYED